MATITANLNGGDETTPDNKLIFKIYGSSDNYTTPILTTGDADTDANVSVSGGIVTIINVNLSSETDIKLSSTDEAGNESLLSLAFQVPAVIDDELTISLFETTSTYEIRRDSDDATQVFTNEELTDGTAESFVGVGNNGLIVNINDNINNYTATQPVLNSQPSIITNGVLNREYSKPVLLFDGVDDFMRIDTFTISQPFTFYFVGRYQSGCPLGSQGGSMDYNMNIGGSDQLVSYAGTPLLSTANQTNKYYFDMFSCIVDGANSSLRFDGGVNATGDTGVGNINGLYIGFESRFNNKFLQGSFSELKVFSGNQSSNILSIEKNIAKTIYNLPSIANVFYGGGQSNFDKRVVLTDPNTPNYISPSDTIVDGVKVFNGNGFELWDLSKVSSVGDGTSWFDSFPEKSKNKWGFSVVSLKQINDSIGNVVLMQLSRGGTSLSGDWLPPNGNLLLDWKTRHNRMKTLLNNFEVIKSEKAMLWHQGERDSALGTENDYEQNWLNLIAEFRNITEQPTLPILYGTISEASVVFNQVIKNAQINVANADADLYCRDNSSLTLYDTAHFDGISSVAFGEWLRQTYLSNY